MTRADVWIGHIWGADLYTIQESNENVRLLHPRGGRRQGLRHDGDLLGRAAPDRRAPVHQPHARRAGQRRNTNFIDYMGPNAAAKEFIDPAILDDPTRQPGPGDRRQARRSCSTSDRTLRDEYLKRWQRCSAAEPPEAGRRRRSRAIDAAAAAGGDRRRAARQPPRVGASLLVARRRLAGRCSSSSRWRSSSSSASGRADALDRIVARRTCRSTTTRRAFDPVFLPTLLNSLRYAALTTILSLAIGYPDRLLDQPLRRAPQGPAADPRDAAVLDELPDPDLRLDDHPARQRGRELDPAWRSG